ncbi:Thiol-disulfide oxidoreductase ResA [Baekduia alba]|uniref:peroxiredoxin-like family protein n=1 Tax=Baekduia alba TaxID=2997333 RepID=UPI002341204B|nr:peroxiredoxin-like family protein [Baekduia alba]WCB92268.1 Thiol-disulfide oxidoreductase ResA [Baekduia alba]
MSDSATGAGSLNDELARQREKTDAQAVRTITAANQALAASGEVQGLELGQLAPEFELPDATGRPVRLSERLALGPVVLTFYRGEWCPYCNITLAALQGVLGEVKDAGASLIAISPQRPDDALTMSEKHGLGFDVLSDAEQSVIRAYGVQFRVPAEIEDVHMTFFKKDISELNADGSWNLPVPATFVLDADGLVRARHVGVEYTSRMEPGEILAALREL